MGEEFKVLGKFIKSKQLIIFLVLMALGYILFHPILSLKQRKALELQERIKESNKSKLRSFGGTSLGKVE
jgi:hypothetical protein